MHVCRMYVCVCVCARACECVFDVEFRVLGFSECVVALWPTLKQHWLKFKLRNIHKFKVLRFWILNFCDAPCRKEVAF